MSTCKPQFDHLEDDTVSEQNVHGQLFEYNVVNKLSVNLLSKFYPIVYHPNYNVGLLGLHYLHYFDTTKWSRINQLLIQHFGNKFTYFAPKREINRDELKLLYKDEFIDQIHSNSKFLANAAEIYLLRFVPSSLLQYLYVTPMKWQTSGSILAAQLAIEHGWAINLGGGFHHASQLKAEGFCLLADISLIIKYLWKYRNPDLKFMIIDLDAHQGNGYAIDKSILLSKERDQIYIFDLYNKDIFPNNAFAKLAINEHIEISSDIQDDEYITLLKKNLACAFNEYKPDLIIYNAGTDVLNGDPLGNMNLTITGVIDRDQIVFEHAKTNNIPIVMLTSGGYQQNNAEIISKSIINLFDKTIIQEIDFKHEIKSLNKL